MKFNELEIGKYCKFLVNGINGLAYIKMKDSYVMRSNDGSVVSYAHVLDYEINEVPSVPPSLDNICKHMKKAS